MRDGHARPLRGTSGSVVEEAVSGANGTSAERSTRVLRVDGPPRTNRSGVERGGARTRRVRVVSGNRGLGGVFGELGRIFVERGDQNRAPDVACEDLLVIELRFSEQNVPFVEVLLAGLVGLAARVISLFTGLRFEPNLGFALFGS